MKKTRILSLVLSAVLVLGLMPSLMGASEEVVTTAAPETTTKTVPLSITEPIPAGDLLKNGDFNAASCVGSWNSNTQTINWVEDENGGYIECSGISQNYRGFIYKTAISAGKYKLTFFVRCAVPGEITILRVNFYHGSTNTVYYLYPTSDEWLKVECYVDAPAPIYQITFAGGTSPILVQDYCIDNMSLVPVDEIPADAPTEFYHEGRKHTYAEVEAAAAANAPTYDMYDKAAEDALYKIDGLFINQDADSFSSSTCSEEDIVAYAMQFKDTHVTDYVLCLNNTLSSFPSEVFEDLADKYYVRDEEGNIIGTDSYYAGSHHIFDELDTDQFGVANDVFREIGINTWISFRMNDCHGRNDAASQLMSDFFYKNPQFRRCPDYRGVNDYWRNAYDFKHQEIRDMWLAYIDEALYRYDVYGIELDWLREPFVFAPGEEAAGVPILNQFVRDVAAIVEKYEELYDHDIKLGIRVASDLQTNLNFGLDVKTWVEDGIIDMLCPSGRYATTDSTIPMAEWKELIGERDIVLAPCIETNIKSYPSSGSGNHTLETYCGYAAMLYEQGADKIYLYNYYRNMGNMMTDEDRITTDSAKLSISSPKQYHNIITTIGSYDKVKTMNRRVIMTYNDLKSPAEEAKGQLPAMVFMFSGQTIKLTQHVGPIPEGATVKLKYSLPNELYKEFRPNTYVNGVECTYEKYEYSSTGITSCPIFVYDVPAEAFDEVFNMEFVPNEFTEIGYVEICIYPAK